MQGIPGLNFPVEFNFYNQFETETHPDAQGEQDSTLPLKLNESSIKIHEYGQEELATPNVEIGDFPQP